MSKRYNDSDSSDSDDDDDDEDPYVRICTPQSRKAGKLCIMLSDCRYDIGMNYKC